MSILAKYRSPWTGCDVSQPAIDIAPSSTPYSNNIILYQGRLTTRPPIYNFLSGMSESCQAIFSFQDLFNVWHTCIVTADVLYQLVNTNGVFSLSPIGPFSDPLGSAYIPTPAYAQLANTAFITAQTVDMQGYIYYWDGTTNGLLVATNLYGGAYMFELDSSICIANTVEGGALFPQRVRWCVSGNFTQWDPNTYKGAGFNDLLDTPDNITGVLTIGTIAYIARTNGLTVMYPTGVGIQPFDFNHLWASEHGTGNIFPMTMASFGSIGFMMSQEDIFAVTVNDVAPIGGKAKVGIYRDLDTIPITSGQPAVMGYVVSRRAYGTVLMQSYNILIGSIGGAPPLIEWSYNIEAKAWTRQVYPLSFSPICRPNYVVVQ